MSTGGIKVRFQPDLTPILEGFKKLPGAVQPEMDAVGRVVEEEMRRGKVYKAFGEMPNVAHKDAKRAANLVIKEMDRMAKEVEADLKHTQREAQRTAREAEQALSRMAAESASRRNDIKQGVGAIFGQGWINDIGDVAGALNALGPAGAVVGTLGASAVVTGAAIGGMAAAAYEITSILYDAALATGELDDENRALEEAQKRLNAAIADGAIPTFEGLTIGATALTLALADLVAVEEDGLTKILNYRDRTSLLTQAFIDAAAPGLRQLDIIRDLSKELRTGQLDWIPWVGEVNAGAKAMKQFNEETERGKDAIAAADRMVAFMLKEAARVKEIGRERIAAAKERRREEERNAKERKAALDKNNAEELKAEEDLAEGKARIARMEREAEEDYDSWSDDQIKSGIKAQAQRDQNAADQRAMTWENSANQVVGTIDTVTQAIIDGARDGSDAQKRAAGIAFDLNRAAGISSVLINTPVAIMKALAELGPVAGPIAAISAGITGAAQIAAISAAPKPYHTGGVIGSDSPRVPGGAPDERLARVRVGEEVSTRQQQGAGSQPVIVQMVYQHKIFNDFAADSIRQVDSPIRKAIAKSSGRRIGHRSSR